MAQKKVFYGSVVSLDTAGGSSYAALGDLIALMPPKIHRGTAETTVMTSTARWKEFIKGLLDGGEPTFRVRLHKTQYTTLFNATIDSSDTIPTWKFAMGALTGESTATNWTFAAIITDLGPKEASIESEGAWECDVTLRSTGAITNTAGS